MYARALSGTRIGIEGSLVEVQCDLARGLPAFNMVGLPEKEVQESRERIRSAITNAGFTYPQGRVTINLAPADVKKRGRRPGFARRCQHSGSQRAAAAGGAGPGGAAGGTVLGRLPAPRAGRLAGGACRA